MHLWRKLAERRWFHGHANILQVRSRGRLAIISIPGRKRLQLEVACTSRNDSRKLIEEFGGHVEKWPRNWLKRFADACRSKPLKIGKRLLISSTLSSRSKRRTSKKFKRSRQLLCVTHLPAKNPSSGLFRPTAAAQSHAQRIPLLVIPASAAFGTGEHATTTMSLGILERLTRDRKDGWSLVDLGTGSGILALAAKRFGAGRVTGIYIDPQAISIAKANARLNEIDNVDFHLGDLRKWKPGSARDIVAANLYVELLIEIVPKLKRDNWLILSGVLRRQEA